MAGLEGKTLGRYELQGLIGRGGMADVYQGYDRHFDRMVAIKVFKRDDEEMLRRFIREAQLMAKLNNPHLVRVYDSDESLIDTISWYYIVMPFMEGGTLRARIRRAPLSPTEACQALQDIADALDYIHQQGIIHRDIKASNVLLDAQGRCYLADFGIARRMTDMTQLTSTGNVLGTVDYIAPELFEEDRKANPRSDLYSLGVLLFEMVTGQVPFHGENQLAVVSMHVNKRPPSPRSISQKISGQVERVILKALEKKPEQRYGSATELAEAFCRAAAASNKNAKSVPLGRSSSDLQTSGTLRPPSPQPLPMDNPLVPQMKASPLAGSTDTPPAVGTHPLTDLPTQEQEAASVGGSLVDLPTQEAASVGSSSLADQPTQAAPLVGSSPLTDQPTQAQQVRGRPLILPALPTPSGLLRSAQAPPVTLRRNVWLFAVIGLVLLLLVTVSIIFAVQLRGGTQPIVTSPQSQNSPTVGGQTQVPTPTPIPTATPNLTATAQTSASTATATAQQATATANTNATATVVVQASATAGVISTATAGAPTYSDALNDANNAATQVANWDQDSHCSFQSNGYHVTEGINLHGCREKNNTYQNATLTVDVSLLNGHSGGLYFRLSTDLLGSYSGYLFEIDSKGNYKISIVTGGNISPLQNWMPSKALKLGYQVHNTLQVIMHTNDFYFYINGVFLVHEMDTIHSDAGALGFLATVDGSSAEVVYSHLNVYPTP